MGSATSPPQFGQNPTKYKNAPHSTAYNLPGRSSEDPTHRLYSTKILSSLAFGAMWRSVAIVKLVKHMSQLDLVRAQTLSYCTMTLGRDPSLNNGSRMLSDDNGSDKLSMSQNPGKDIKHRIGKNVPKKDRVSFLVNTLLDLQDSKEAVYGTLDSWAAWEREFPIGHLKRALITLEKEQQWHRVIQVIKWMLSKGQGTTLNTYGQLIRALDMDHRVKEAHEIWVKKVGDDLHSVPWQLCKLMIGVYYRNNMLDNLVKLFIRMESFDRKIYEKSVLMKIADSYEMLGLPEEKDRVLEKYSDLIDETSKRHNKKFRGAPSKKT